jgi:hypothetical protein
MGDLLRQGSQWLEQQRDAFCSSPVTYLRDIVSYPVNATFGRTNYEVADDYGATIQTHVVDFLILAESLPFEPEPADVIVADDRKYEVMNLGGEGCWRWSDPYRTTMRIHTKDVGVAT